jgi:hypothetical protein
LDSRESGRAVNDQLPDADLFSIEAIPEYPEDVVVFLSTINYPNMYSAAHK